MDDAIALIEKSLDVRYDSGDVTAIERPHTTGWRVLPTLVTAQMSEGHSQITLDGGSPVAIAEGDALVVGAGVLHRIDLRSPRGISRWSHLDVRAFGGAVDALSLIEPPSRLSGATARRIGDLNQALAVLAKQPAGIAQAAQRKALGFEIFALIAAASPAVPAALD
ncbi:MAG: hypothetical protein H0W72_05760, partial [Planctomycetes bacterium]|nr:hypothetical protein [Planctomycetota bacterium]